jgi:hypothetical protein
MSAKQSLPSYEIVALGNYETACTMMLPLCSVDAIAHIAVQSPALTGCRAMFARDEDDLSLKLTRDFVHEERLNSSIANRCPTGRLEQLFVLWFHRGAMDPARQ